VLLHEGDLPFLDTEGHKVAIIAPIEELSALRLLGFPFEERQQVKAVEVDLERLAVQRRLVCRPPKITTWILRRDNKRYMVALTRKTF
jgi:hypothetical protein